MKFLFILPRFDVSGGGQVVFHYAEQLLNLGHDVTVAAPRMRPTPWGRYLKSLLRFKGIKPRRVGENFTLMQRSRAQVRFMASADGAGIAPFVGGVDFIISTWWETALWVEELGETGAEHVQFIQGHEVFDYLDKSRVVSALKLDRAKIVVSPWLEQVMRSEYNARRVYLCMNGLNVDAFKPDHRRQRNKRAKIGFVYTPAARKTVSIAIDALQSLKDEGLEFDAFCFGAKKPGAQLPLPDWITFHLLPDPAQIKTLYQQADIWLWTSLSEGFGLPLLEALTAGTPVVATPAGAAQELINEDRGRLVAHSKAAVETAVKELLALPDAEWQKLSDNAQSYAEDFDWSRRGHEIETIFMALSREMGLGDITSDASGSNSKLECCE